MTLDSPNEPTPPHGASSDGSRLKAREVLEWLTGLALVVYGAVHFGDYAFYARLGVSPDDVGLDYARTLGKVAGGLVLLGATLALLIAAGARLSSTDEGSTRWWARLLVWPLALFVSFLLLATLLPPLPRWTLLIAGACLVRLGAFLDAKRRSEGLRSLVRDRDPMHLLAFGALGLIVTFAAFGIAGYRAAGYVRGGKELPCGCTNMFGLNVALPWVSGSRGFMGVEAQTAYVWWADGGRGRRPPLPEPAAYLGSADGLVVLYDVSRKATIRVPAQSVAFATEPRPIAWRERPLTSR
jgi:hypothetical protein